MAGETQSANLKCRYHYSTAAGSITYIGGIEGDCLAQDEPDLGGAGTLVGDLGGGRLRKSQLRWLITIQYRFESRTEVGDFNLFDTSIRAFVPPKATANQHVRQPPTNTSGNRQPTRQATANQYVRQTPTNTLGKRQLIRQAYRIERRTLVRWGSFDSMKACFLPLPFLLHIVEEEC